MSKRVRSRIRGRNTIGDFLSHASVGFQKIKSVKSKPKGYKRGRSPVVLLFLLLVWSISLGWGMAISFGSPPGVSAQIAPGIPAQPDLIAQGTAEQTGTVDPITPRYQLGKELYLENCASCHVPLPPEVLPSETWRRLLLEPEQHFGQQLKPLIGPVLITMWDYIRAYSRPEEAKKPLPYRISESPYFKALHPRVKFSQTVKPASCVICHPGAAQYNYRRLTPEWENSP
ncbi:diheme cytochrome C [Allocoleopsis franciscana]|uniref:Dihem cytochrome c n=1 Tax=Allocoleopsis franciscana PCC 7113 TaxID=1173027 RepID=K9WJK1_9CYAN|nr:diheme cytochrome C [Allocoleopsis franciscana]AFZ20373.1 Dihem cytochrome c [Allocoleopsis franciscana PCC 7113]